MSEKDPNLSFNGPEDVDATPAFTQANQRMTKEEENKIQETLQEGLEEKIEKRSNFDPKSSLDE